MPKKLIKRYLPSPDKIRNAKGLGILGKWLQNPSIWHLHRRSVSRAFIIGMFWMAIPIPSQMLVAAVFAIIFRANLPLSVALVWISNPLTMPPIFYFNYVVGTYILGQQAAEDWHFELSWEWMIHTLDDLWMPLFLGSAVVGLALGLISYVIINLLWRHHAIKAWNARRSKKWRKKFREEEKAQRDHS